MGAISGRGDGDQDAKDFHRAGLYVRTNPNNVEFSTWKEPVTVLTISVTLFNKDLVSQTMMRAMIEVKMTYPETSGESYAGKHAPEIAYKIMKENSRRGSHLRINLKGIIVGSGFTNPYTQNDYGEYLCNMGLIDEADMVHFKNEEEKIRKLIKIQNWLVATEAVQSFILGFPHQERSYFENSTHFRFYMNILKTTVPQPFKN
ncbi:unnamed protein product [Allacma fusca]|uniref:Uncharacterized protein n=1 Tax=Allacma fusca TaxID=39272 RepID=A0A8J2J6N5_9HEXA|nr:unnamed protein product [Allacma fusca]